MPTELPDAEKTRPLPERPNLRHLKDQAKDLRKAGRAESLSAAQFQIARMYGFGSWAKLKAHVESLEEAGELKLAIDRNDFAQVKEMMTKNPALHRAPLGYGKSGPLTWAAECRIPWEPPSAERLAMAEWMIENGSDVHQGGDGPLMRAALMGHRIPMMELLVAHGADVNAEWGGYFPILFAPCETVEPDAIAWLLRRGANPNCAKAGRKYPGTALDYVMGTYGRSKQLGRCIDLLLEAGGTTRCNVPAVLDLLRERLDLLEQHLQKDRRIVERRFGELDFGATGARRLILRSATLLHVAAEYGNAEAAKLLLERGADVNARAEADSDGLGGQTPIFHAVTQYGDYGIDVARLLIECGADLTIRAKLPGHYEAPDEVVECTPLGYAMRFPGANDHSSGRGPGPESKTIALLRERGAPE
ncbi:MAG TPA: ankyrin repeat domain-containing protein [Candidatus Acidoferrales bacterium]|nr:ankyrin repeat domain-containing protein [Candidatus Acidoferrales bacterium]